MSLRLGLFTALLVALDLWFWLTADFRTFVPPSSGGWHGGWHDVLEAGLIFGLPAVLLVGSAVYWRRFFVLRLGGYLGVLLWFFTGHMFAFLRIT
ncbi:MAG: hypothetical protein HY812_15075 [Planctomycetes bacterium]|nr:hypothetical protein [Planctomycetota bacterium]